LDTLFGLQKLDQRGREGPTGKKRPQPSDHGDNGAAARYNKNKETSGTKGEGRPCCVGNNELEGGISLFHNSTTAGHPESRKTLALTRTVLCGGQNMKNYTTEYIKGCATANSKIKHESQQKTALFPLHPDAQKHITIVQTISLDFIVKPRVGRT